MYTLRGIRFGGAAGLWAALMLLIAAPPALAQGVSVSGLIVARDGDHMTVSDSSGQQTIVTLTDETRVTSVGGTFGLQKDDMAVTDLINGLAVNVKGHEAGGGVEATEVTFKPSDLKRAKVVEAGTAQVKAHAQELQAQNAELKQRMSEANQYVEKGSTTILFATGSATISAQGKQQLQAIAEKARGTKGYLIGVSGHADTTGDSLANQKLSERRADAVIRYLQRHANVQPYRILSTVAVGDIQQISNNDTPQGRAANRRVVVQVLTNKGLEGL
jgi:outer membrane protein OmpA-like peptidoglycan-associated protein